MMGTLQYRGRPPDTDFSVLHKKWVDDEYDTVKVDNAFVNNATATEAIPLASKTYVDNQDNLREHIATVDAADLNYILATQLGVAGGVANIGSDGYVPSDKLPTLVTERQPFFVNADSVALTTAREITTQGAKGFRAATLSISDPGYPYIPMFFASVQGGAVNGVQSIRQIGTGSFGQISVLRSDDLKYNWCLCSSKKAVNTYCPIPFGDTTITPTVLPPLHGATNWGLWLGLWSGTTFTYYPTALRFYCIVWPGI